MADKLISAEALKSHYAWWGEHNEARRIFDDIIEAQKEAVVRCKDCANRGWECECPLFENAYITGGGDEGSNFYCAWGERREDE